MFQKNFIVIDGIIGTGKSTLTEQLAKTMGWEPYYEPVKKNPYLELFYKDMKQYGFAMQIYYLNARYRQMKSIVGRLGTNEISGAISDRGIWCDTIFAEMLHEQGNINDTDYATYLDMFDNFILKDMVLPQVMVYLKCSPETALERIKQRGREAEKDMSIDYLRDLKNHYEKFFESMKPLGVNILTLDWEEFQPVEDVIEQIKAVTVLPNEFAKWVRPLRTAN
jgi:deoxyadenosine/deoxycytidine kinase